MAEKSAVNRIEEMLHEQPLPELAHSWKPKDASVAFENVSFCYPGTEEKVLDHVTFEIPEGKTVALVGLPEVENLQRLNSFHGSMM